MADKETKLDRPINGLFLMSTMTTIWVILAEYFFNNLDYKAVSIVFGIVIIYFIIKYIAFNRHKERLPQISKIKDPKKQKAFWIIFCLEGVAILLVQNVLVNIGKDTLFISSIALIVGLHFIPLAKVFQRKFDYYIGLWTIIVATVGLILIINKKYDYNIVNAFVCVACAISTTFYGLKMIKDGTEILNEKC